MKTILKRKPWSTHPDDHYLEIVLAEVDWGYHPYVTWGLNKSRKEGEFFFEGHYFETFEEAEQDFERR